MQIYFDKIFYEPEKVIKAFDEKELKKAFDELENLSGDYFALGYIRYEAKEVFLNRCVKSKNPLLYFEVYKDCEKYCPKTDKEIFLKAKPEILYHEYSRALSKIKEEISFGNTYEVNYTYDWSVECDCSEIELYEYLLKKQKTPYNAFIKNDYETLLSFSPELFFELDREKHFIKTKPMKGTVKRGETPQQDKELIEFLKNDIKNRAENVMIVDLLRNDLSKISKPATVEVPKLFEIETHSTLHQMTSEVTAELFEGVSFYEIFQAIFPCGSITGAPKISTMKIIDREEKGQRNIYCGAIGFITPQKAVFSVPIRILQKEHGKSSYQYRVGGAIVQDSDILDEWEESVTKASFLNKKDFKIVETLKFEDGKLLYFDEHIRRMKNTAEIFGFKFNLEELNFDLNFKEDLMIRILLSQDGISELQYFPLSVSNTGFVRISEKKTDSKNIFLKHKTTYRPWYEETFEKIKKGIVYDELFFNEKEELTEGARTNIVLKINEKLYTPPLECGLLNGVMREKMIREQNVIEKVLYLDDLLKAQKIFCINSVRGIKEVRLDSKK